jgi:hypothetical protein
MMINNRNKLILPTTILTAVGILLLLTVLSPQTHAQDLQEALFMEKADEKSELLLVRGILTSIDPTIEDLAKEDALLAALKIRNIIYKKTPVLNTWTEIDFANLDHWFYLALFDDSKGHLCLGLAAAYGIALTSFGIDSREVTLLQSVAPYSDGHNSIEFWDGTQWIASDPTFDIFFLGKNNKRLSFSEVRDYCRRPESFTYEFGADSPLQGRSNIETYYISICKLINYIAFSPSSRSDFEVLPVTWDGVIKYKTDNTMFDVKGQLEGVPWKSLKRSHEFRGIDN